MEIYPPSSYIPQSDEKTPHDMPRSLVAHLEELRARLIQIIIIVILAAAGVYYFRESIMVFLLKPVGPLVFIAPQEALVTYLKIALFGGVLCSVPVMLFHVWRFIGVALSKEERRGIFVFAPLSLGLFIAGAAFGYCLIVPIGMKFLLGFAGEYMRPMITVSNYISFVGMLTLVFGTVFEVPLVMLFLAMAGLVRPEMLARKRRHAIVIIFVLAACLTPPDIITQTALALPLVVLYEIGVLGARLVGKNRHFSSNNS